MAKPTGCNLRVLPQAVLPCVQNTPFWSWPAASYQSSMFGLSFTFW